MLVVVVVYNFGQLRNRRHFIHLQQLLLIKGSQQNTFWNYLIISYDYSDHILQGTTRVAINNAPTIWYSVNWRAISAVQCVYKLWGGRASQHSRTGRRDLSPWLISYDCCVVTEGAPNQTCFDSASRFRLPSLPTNLTLKPQLSPPPLHRHCKFVTLGLVPKTRYSSILLIH